MNPFSPPASVQRAGSGCSSHVRVPRRRKTFGPSGVVSLTQGETRLFARDGSILANIAQTAATRRCSTRGPRVIGSGGKRKGRPVSGPSGHCPRSLSRQMRMDGSPVPTVPYAGRCAIVDFSSHQNSGNMDAVVVSREHASEGLLGSEHCGAAAEQADAADEARITCR